MTRLSFRQKVHLAREEAIVSAVKRLLAEKGYEQMTVDEVAAEPALRLRGLMAVAPLGGDPEVAFARLADLHAGVLERHTEATWLSAGMSGDLEAAVRHGATHLRVGTAILGSRPSLG